MGLNELMETYPLVYPVKPSCGVYYPIGWENLVLAFSQEVTEYLEKNPIQGFFVTQIKEKFGELTIYVQCGDKNIYDIIDKYGKLSLETCTQCGSGEGILRTDGWINVICKECYED